MIIVITVILLWLSRRTVYRTFRHVLSVRATKLTGRPYGLSAVTVESNAPVVVRCEYNPRLIPVVIVEFLFFIYLFMNVPRHKRFC